MSSIPANIVFGATDLVILIDSFNNKSLLHSLITTRDIRAVIMIHHMSKTELEDVPGDLLLLAIQSNHQITITALLRKGLKSSFAMDEAIRYSKNDIVAQLIAHDIGVTQWSMRLARMYNKDAEQQIIKKINSSK